MKKLLILSIFTAVLYVPATVYSYSFSDDFNDGDLAGWTMKQGTWSNPGDSLLASSDPYGVIWKDDSFGFNQQLEFNAYFDGNPTSRKTACPRLRTGDAGYGPNPFFDHGYTAYVKQTEVSIYNDVAPYHQERLGSLSLPTSLSAGWHLIDFSVYGLGAETNLKLWVDSNLYLDVFDTSGYQHDDGGYIGFQSGNGQIKLDNISGQSDVEPVPEPATLCLLGFGLLGIATFRKKNKTKCN